MTLAAGTRLGPYEVTGPLGEGGMGEVYRATDTNLGRDVAIKVLPEAFAQDAERVARFDREARTLASLNHPHIAQVYGLEKADGTLALVMELVEGPTLADRIAQGPLPVEEALEVAKQIAEALEAAHEQGIVHRDLKPANVKVREDGTVKVLDFGLAKGLEPAAASSPEESHAPTLTSPALSQAGMILGTAAYMSPEQAKGRAVDKRADVWAFGAVLYEMLTGRRAFAGEDVTETLAAVVRVEVDWSRLPAGLPPAVRMFLRRCLQKDPKQRVRDIGDVRWALEGGSDPELGEVGSGAGTAQSGRQRVVPWAAGIAVGIGIGAAAMLLGEPGGPERPAAATRRARLLLTSGGVPIADQGYRFFSVDAGGRHLVFTGIGGNRTRQLFLRPLDGFDAAPIPGTDGVEEPPAPSPDGRWVAFVAGLQIKKVALAGGSPMAIHDLETSPHGLAWLGGDAIVFGTPEGLWWIPHDGGAPERLTTVDVQAGEVDHRWPDATSDGTILTYTVWRGSLQNSQLRLRSLVTGVERTMPDLSGRVTTSGHLIIFRQDSLWGAPLDRQSLEIRADATPLVESVAGQSNGWRSFDVTDDGSLVYHRRSDRAEPLALLDPAGRIVRQVGEPFGGVHHGPPRFSTDGNAVAVTRHAVGQQDQVVIHDLRRGDTTIPVGGLSRYPVWSPDGSRLAFGSQREGTWDIFEVALAGGQEPAPLLVRDGEQRPEAWSPDEQLLAYTEGSPGSLDIWLLPRGGEPFPFAAHPSADERLARFSADGQFLAYDSDESGLEEVYVQEVPQGRRLRVSSGGGRNPAWAAGRIYYESLDGSQVFSAALRAGPRFEVGAPETVFSGLPSRPGGSPSVDVSPDGESFVALQDAFADPELRLVVNWFEELDRLGR